MRKTKHYQSLLRYEAEKAADKAKQERMDRIKL